MSAHHNQQHPAVGAVACPYCLQPAGTPCVTAKLSLVVGQRTETHNVRVAAYHAQQLQAVKREQ